MVNNVLLMVQKSGKKPPGINRNPHVNNGISDKLPTSTGELDPDFWTHLTSAPSINQPWGRGKRPTCLQSRHTTKAGQGEETLRARGFMLGKNTYILGGGFKYVLFSPRKLGKWSNLTSIFFRWAGLKPPTSIDWNYPPHPGCWLVTRIMNHF